MRGFFGLIFLVLVGIYVWGWFVHVQGGLMDTSEYTWRFGGLVAERAGDAFDGAKRLAEKS